MEGPSKPRLKAACFFQAEAGIAFIGVTGVQTCALPISSSAPTRSPQSERPSWPRHAAGRCRRATRSEKRRVGKECRSGSKPQDETDDSIDYVPPTYHGPAKPVTNG